MSHDEIDVVGGGGGGGPEEQVSSNPLLFTADSVLRFGKSIQREVMI